MELKDLLKEFLLELQLQNYSDRTIKLYKNSIKGSLLFAEKVDLIYILYLGYLDTEIKITKRYLQSMQDEDIILKTSIISPLNILK